MQWQLKMPAWLTTLGDLVKGVPITMTWSYVHAYSTCSDGATRTAFQAVLMKHMEIPTSPQTMYLKPIRQATMFKHVVSGNVQHTQKSLQVRSD